MKLSITDRFRSALLPHNRLATVIGSIVGGAVPVAVYHIVHAELDIARPLYGQAKFFLVLAGLLFSALSVYGVALDVFSSAPKAFGFVVLIEGSMSLADERALSLSMLAILVVLNAVSASIALANQQRETRRENRKDRPVRVPGSSGDVLSLSAVPDPAPAPKRVPARRAAGTSLARLAKSKAASK